MPHKAPSKADDELEVLSGKIAAAIRRGVGKSQDTVSWVGRLFGVSDDSVRNMMRAEKPQQPSFARVLYMLKQPGDHQVRREFLKLIREIAAE